MADVQSGLQDVDSQDTLDAPDTLDEVDEQSDLHDVDLQNTTIASESLDKAILTERTPLAQRGETDVAMLRANGRATETTTSQYNRLATQYSQFEPFTSS